MAEGDCAPDGHIVPEPGWPEETSSCANQREAAEIDFLKHSEFGHSEPALEQQCGRSVEDLEVTRIKNDPGGIAVAPFDPHRAGIAGCRHRDLVSAWRHAQRAVKADHLAVKIGVMDAVKHERGELARLAQTL